MLISSKSSLRKSGEGLSLGGMLPSRSKVQHLLGTNNSLGPHPLVKSQRFTVICVRKLSRVWCTDPVGLAEVRASWPEDPRLSKKKNSLRKSDFDLTTASSIVLLHVHSFQPPKWEGSTCLWQPNQWTSFTILSAAMALDSFIPPTPSIGFLSPASFLPTNPVPPN